MKFKGWTCEDERKECPNLRWADFNVVLHSNEIGETFTCALDIKRILKASGYRIKLEKVK